ncbi:hypothetical protein ACGFW5_10690 [Streptomyces sp. NPDC048416]|uniref:hypothetical protein n=1 Tax=Streptomyces sp. NPDC048416 TaxID=3365546 RepID=UPI0037115EF4
MKGVSGAPLWWQLVRMGRSAAHRAESGRTRFIALILATLVAGLSAAAFVASSATFDGRESRARARTPVMAEGGRQAKALWSSYGESEHGREYSVIVIAPLTDDAPLPPGLDRWPAPGQAYLSPALAEGPGSENYAGRYGKVVGRIGGSGLATPGERLVYTRPSAGLLNTAPRERISGFGSSVGPAFGDVKDIGEGKEKGLAMIMALLLGLPSVVLAVAAARLGAHGHDRRARLLDCLGAGRRRRFWMDLGACALPVALGTALAALLLIPALLTDITLPWIDYTLAAADLRRAAGPLLGVVIGAGLAVLATSLLLQPATRRRTRARRAPHPSGGLLRTVALVACPCFFALSVLSGLMRHSNQSPILYVIAVLGALATLPSVIAVLIARAAPRLANAARRGGSAGQLIAARSLAARPGVVVRLVSTLVVAIGVIGQTQLITSMLDNRSGDTRVLDSTEGRSMATVHATERARPSGEFRAALPPGIRVISLGHVNAPSGGPSSARTIQAPCPDLAALRLPCPAPGATAEVGFGSLDRRLTTSTYSDFGDAPAIVRTGEATRLEPQDLWLLVFTDRADPLDIPELKRVARLSLSTDAVVRSLAEGNQSYTLGHQARWLPFLGTAGTLVIALAMTFSALSEFLRFSRDLAPVAVLTGHGHVFGATARWALGLPTLAAGAAGIAAYVVLAQPVSGGPEGADLSGTLCLMFLLLTTALAVTTVLAARTAALREAGVWRPRAD